MEAGMERIGEIQKIKNDGYRFTALEKVSRAD